MKYTRPGIIEFSLSNPEDLTTVPCGRDTSYNPDTFPLLAQGWARDGLTNKQIFENLGISEASFYKYLRLYPEFLNALKAGRTPVNIEIENAIIKAAKGYNYKEITNEALIDKETGQIIQIVKRKEVTKHAPPSLGHAKFWQMNRDKTKPWNAEIETGSGFINDDLEIIIEDVDDGK
jgi:hypothetical protein